MRCTYSIQGLEEIMQCFNLNPDHLVALRYFGGSEFYMEIFNQYGVEIDYSHGGTHINYIMLF